MVCILLEILNEDIEKLIHATFVIEQNSVTATLVLCYSFVVIGNIIVDI